MVNAKPLETTNFFSRLGMKFGIQRNTFNNVESRELVADRSVDEGIFIDEFADVESRLFVDFPNGAGHGRLVFVHLSFRKTPRGLSPKALGK